MALRADPALQPQQLQSMVRTALAEDIGEGDATTLAIAPKGVVVNARLVARERCVVAGLQIVEAVLSETSSNAALSIHVEDGEVCEADQCLAEISGESYWRMYSLKMSICLVKLNRQHQSSKMLPSMQPVN